MKEWFGPSRDECLRHPHPPACAFGDISQFLIPPLQAMLQDLKGGQMLESKLKPLIAQGSAVKQWLSLTLEPHHYVCGCGYIVLILFVMIIYLYFQSYRISPVVIMFTHLHSHRAQIIMIARKAFCILHGRECSVTDHVAAIHIAGTPCTAYSPIGLMDKETAISFAHFLTWVGLRITCQEVVVVQECTDTFPRSVFHELLPMYDWCFMVICPTMFGWPVRRPRQWCVYLQHASDFCLSSRFL